MIDTSVVSARINADVKARAESILARLGIPPAAAIQMFYSQIVLHNGIPFPVRLPAPADHLPAPGPEPQDRLDAELEKGFESLSTGRTYTLSEAAQELNKEDDI